jgi:hypothetical protein
MGSLIPNPMDQEIVFKLNTIFSGNSFKALSAHSDADSKGLFHSSKKLSRVARRIGAYPQSNDNTDSTNTAMPTRRNPRARWYHFLEMLETQHDTSGAGPTTADAIKDSLQAAISAGNIVGVVFDVSYTPTSAKAKHIFLHPNNTSPGQIFQVGNSADYVMVLTLICQDHIPSGAISNPRNKGSNELPVANMVWPIDDQDQNQP